MLYSSYTKIAYHICLSMLLLVVLLTTTTCNGRKTQTWTITQLSAGVEAIEEITEVVIVRGCCELIERKSVSCSAGTYSEFAAGLAASIGISAIGEIALDPNVQVALGRGIERGESLELAPPPNDTIYLYNITTIYTVKLGEAEIRTPAGEKTFEMYRFRSQCSLRIEPLRQTMACNEECIILPPATPSAIIFTPDPTEIPPTQQIEVLATQPPPTTSPKPQIKTPVYGEYRNPITFEWSGSQFIDHRVVLTHLDRVDKRYMSDWVKGFAWTTNIPEEDWGNWEWYVITRDGNKSDVWKFVFQPYSVQLPQSLQPTQSSTGVTPPYPPLPPDTPIYP